MFKRNCTVPAGLFYLWLLLVPCSAFSGTWERLSGERFNSIVGAGTDILILLREPGDMLRSTDDGLTWHVVYHTIQSLGPLQSFKDGNIGSRIDSATILMSLDSGRSWFPQHEPVTQKDEITTTTLTLRNGNRLALRNGSKILRCNHGSWMWRPMLVTDSTTVLNSITLIGSRCYAVGEPGVIYVSDTAFKSWSLLTRSPFTMGALGSTISTRNDTASARYHGSIQFVSAASGMVRRDNKIWFTSDSATTWREVRFKDTLTSSLLLSDKDALVATTQGEILRVQSVGNSWSVNAKQHISDRDLRIGWFNQSTEEIFILGDSSIYYSNIGFDFFTGTALNLTSNVRPLHVAFPNKYCGYLLVERHEISDTSFGRATPHIVNPVHADSTFIYRTLDGGASWVLLKSNPIHYGHISFISASRGWACGDDGNLLWTEDSGSTWGEWMVYEKLNNIKFVNDSEGFAVGDSGSVYFSQNGGHQFGEAYPEPKFYSFKNQFVDVAFSDQTTVYVLGMDCCYRRTIPRTFEIAYNQSIGKHLDHATITAVPNPASTLIRLTVTSQSDHSVPRISILDVAGRCVINTLECQAESDGSWSALANITSLSNGYYSAVATIGSDAAYCKFMVIHSN